MTPKKSTPCVHLICNAHIDPIWQWDWEEGLTETLATFEVAADLIDEYPEFIFNHNESLLYEKTKLYRPDLFERIKKHVASGRWVITGGWYVQPDCNLPSGEGFVRQALVGRTFFSEEFGVEPKVAYNLDPFGHQGNLPQILKKTGVEMYVHFRPDPVRCPSGGDFLYRWRGIDGSEVAVLRPPCGWYNTFAPDHLRTKVEGMRKLAAETGRKVTAFWGAGDHGGGATRADIETIRDMAKDADAPEVRHSSFEDFQKVTRKEIAQAPLVEGELQKCFMGCYTSVVDTKQGNRRGEGLALAAERWASLAWWLVGKDYPKEEIDEIWKGVLFNQFHDILPGSSTRKAFQGVMEIYGKAFTQAREVLLQSYLALLQNQKRRKPLAMCVFNPQARARTIPLEIQFQGATSPQLLVGKSFRIIDAAGRSVPYQTMRPASSCGEWQQRFLLNAKLPALGMGEFRVKLVDGPLPKAKPAIRARRTKTRLSLSTDLYSVAFNTRTGLLDSLKDKKSGREMLAKPGGELIVREDNADAWGGEPTFAYGKVVGRFRCPSQKDLSEVVGGHGIEVAPAVRVTESGPLATRVEVIQTYGRSVARVRYTFHADHPEIGLEVLLNWGERRRVAQLAFPTTLDPDAYTVEVPHGALERKGGMGEMPCGRWTMLASPDKKAAFALVNCGPGGVDVDRGVLRQSLVRSPIFCTMRENIYPDSMADHMDMGEHIWQFNLRVGAATDVRAALPELADDLMMPPATHIHLPLGPMGEKGVEPGRDLVALKGKGVQVAAVKQSQDGNGLTVRVIETAGRKATAELRVARKGKVPAALKLKLTPYEIKTLRLGGTAKDNGWSERDLLERPL